MAETAVWTEKYRPKTLAEVRGQHEITSRLEAFVKAKNFPHLLFAGPAGTGKTTATLATAREMYGDGWRNHILELNASDARGIDVIRGRVKEFARSKAIEEVPFKIIYLDESDALTKEAQQALRRTMEDYTQTVRFILSCNYSSKIITPIQSRCAVFRFKPLAKEIVFDLLKTITSNEGITISEDALELIHYASEGDMRKAENILQACASLTKSINEKSVAEVISFAEPREIADIAKLAVQGNFADAKKRLVDVMLTRGLAGMDVIKQIQSEVLNMKLDDKVKVALIRTCGEYEFRLVEGSNEFIQLSALLAEFAIIGQKA